MKKLFIFVILLTFVCCTHPKKVENVSNESSLTLPSDRIIISKTIFEGHNYIKIESHVYGGWVVTLTHDPDCPCHGH